MKFVSDTDTDPPEACMEQFDFGEVEDYCINIVEGNMPDCATPQSLDTVITELYSAQLNWTDSPSDHEDHNVRYRKLGSFDWTIIQSVDSPHQLANLEECTIYEAQVQANCTDGGASIYTSSLVFKTDCITSVSDPNQVLSNILVNPNPFTETFYLSFQLDEATNLAVDLFSTSGQMVNLYEEQNLQANVYKLTFSDLNHLPAGLYIIRIKTSENLVLEKIVKLQ